MKIYELKLEQQKALEELEWAENDEEALATLEQIRGDVNKKLEFLTGLLAESITQTTIAKTALDEAKKRLEINYKRKTKTEEKLREFITSVLIDFNVKKFNGSILSVSRYESSGSLNFTDTFDYAALPDTMYELVVNPIIDKAAVKKFIVDGHTIPGVTLDKKEILRIS